ncbi:MAG: hypothetical protein IJ272_10100 [Clostridia bacterium]|nr:hypothetical protein [Clostridia bacterium]
MLNAIYIVSVGVALIAGLLASGRYSKMTGRPTSLVKPAILSVIPIVNLFFIGLSLTIIYATDETFQEAWEKKEDDE